MVSSDWIGYNNNYYFSIADLFRFLIDFLNEWRVKHPILRFWAGPFPIFMIYTPEASEVRFKLNNMSISLR